MAYKDNKEVNLIHWKDNNNRDLIPYVLSQI
jgi:hypothetical protein